MSALSTKASNPGHDDRWTCPACYQDMPVKFPTSCTCKCGARVQLIREMQPVCTAILIGSEEEGECEECGDRHVSPSVEAFEQFGRVLCEECADAALEDATDDGDGA